MSDNKFKVAIVGCGRISKLHFDAINKHKDKFVLTSICDVDQNILNDHKKKLSVNGYSDLKELLKNEILDLVVLCTPSGLHSKQAELIASKSINVLTEKPMATSYKDGVSMVKKCKDFGVNLFVMKQNRNNSTIKILKRAIDEKRFGNIKLIQINVFWTRPQSYYDQAEWRGTKKFDGGAVMNQASHYVDFLDYLFGPVKSINCMSETSRDIEVEDTAVMNIRWGNGLIGSMSVTMLTYPSNIEGSVTVIGETGFVKIGGNAVNKVENWIFKDFKNYDKDINNMSYETASVYGYGHESYYKNIIGVLEGKDRPQTDGEEGLKSLEIIIAAYLSAKTKQTINLPIKTNDL